MQKIPFKPALHHEDMYSMLRMWDRNELRNIGLYRMVSDMVSLAEPSKVEEKDTYWEDFYLPLRRDGRRITVPFCISEYDRKFFAHFHRFGVISIAKGDEHVDNFYIDLFKDAIMLIPYLRETGNELAQRTTPYDYRTGKILSRHALEKLMSQRTKKRILKEYEQHEKKGLEQKNISLDDYLETAAICYRAALPKRCKGITPREMYNRWADGRHGGMLDIKDTVSKDEFKEWYKSKAWQGCHPFEIVFSLWGHGIHLYPPSDHEPRYSLTGGDYSFLGFIAMARALIKNGVPFEAPGLRETLDLLAGDSYMDVNGFGFEGLDYYPCAEHKKKYFHHIEWDALNLLQWKETK